VRQNTNEYRLARKYNKRKKGEKPERKRSLKLTGRGGRTIVLGPKIETSCFLQDVTGYPTLKFFKSGYEKDDGIKYRGDR
jgi:hypothetical protein